MDQSQWTSLEHIRPRALSSPHFPLNHRRDEMASDQVFRTMGILRHLVSQHGELLRPCGCHLLDQSHQAVAEALKTLEYQLVIPTLSNEGRSANRDLKTAMMGLVDLLNTNEVVPVSHPPPPPPPPPEEVVTIDSSTPLSQAQHPPPPPPQPQPQPVAGEPQKKKKKTSSRKRGSNDNPIPLKPKPVPQTTSAPETLTPMPTSEAWEAFINDPEVQQLIQDTCN